MRQVDFKHWSWMEFSETHIISGQNRTHRIPGTPCIDIVSINGGEKMEIRIHAPLKATIPRDTSTMARIAVTGGSDSISVSTQTRELYPEFYHIAVLIADRIQIREEDPLSVVVEVLADIRHLAAQSRPLSDNEEIGLFGELWMLRLLIEEIGTDAVKAWIGPGNREHDFRFGNIELEVKTTSRVRRIHVIHGLAQMVPSTGKTLLLISVHISPAGAGSGDSLLDLRQEVSCMLKGDADAFDSFRQRMDSYGLEEKDWTLYSRLWELRSPVAVIESSECPSITHEGIRKILPADMYSRVEGIEYEINVEGLGYNESNVSFAFFLESLKEGLTHD